MNNINVDNLNYETARNIADISNIIEDEIFNFNEMDNGYNVNKTFI